MSSTTPGDGFQLALIAELAKKSSVCWVRYDGATYPVWHVWSDDALCLVSGGDEQPLPGIGGQGTVEVILRSRQSGGRLMTWQGRVEVVAPADPRWPAVTATLVAERLNLDDQSTAAARWAEESVVTRIVPSGPALELPGSLSAEDHAAPPGATPATTRTPLPRVLHRRVQRRQRLS